MSVEVARGREEHLRVVVKTAKATVAGSAKESTNVPGTVVMVYRQRQRRLAASPSRCVISLAANGA
jgi:hypothetical protein